MMPRDARMVVVLLTLAWIGGCAESQPSVQEQCEMAMEHVAACFPGVSFEAECTDETLKAFENNGFDGGECSDVNAIGKADWFSFGGCGYGEHECGLIFCCDDYLVTWFPQESDWDMIGAVQLLHDSIPADAQTTLAAAEREDLVDGVSTTYQQKVSEFEGGVTQDMAVEVSMGLTEVPYETFSSVLSADRWGVKLAHYLGGEVIVYEVDEFNRPTRQLERMVLSPFPCDWETGLTNMDMTKVEAIVYEEDRAIVYWRVMYSDNNSTEVDIGSVEFKKYDEASTLITFHSAHRLNAPLGIHIPNDLVEFVLKTFFVGHIEHYGKLVKALR